MKNAFLIFIAAVLLGLAVWYAFDPGTVETGISVAITVIVGGCAWVVNRVTVAVRGRGSNSNAKRDPRKVTDQNLDSLQHSVQDVEHAGDELARAVNESGSYIGEVGSGIRLSARELERLDESVRKSSVIAHESSETVRQLGDQLRDGERELDGVIDIVARRKK